MRKTASAFVRPLLVALGTLGTIGAFGAFAAFGASSPVLAAGQAPAPASSTAGDASQAEPARPAPASASASVPAPTSASAPGILLLAHGGNAVWNQNVETIASAVDQTMPVEVAFGMATRANIQSAVDRLTARGVSRVVAVPLFVSSHSSVITSTEYLLGLRQEMPPELRIFAKMSHGPAGGGGDGDSHAAHAGHAPAAPAVDGTTPVQSSLPIAMTPALDAHPVVSAIVSARAAAISREPARETVVLVAHGPVDDETNDRWLANLRVVGDEVQRAGGYAAVDVLTVRDDAPAPVRDAAAAELRALVERRAQASRVLVVPVLLSYGGIEDGIRKRLAGLDYAMSTQALAPDERLVDWVLEMARR